MSDPRGSRRLWRPVLLVAVPLAAGAAGLYQYASGGRYIETENAYVKAHIIAVSAEVAGRVTEVGVRDNQAVEAGELLFGVDRAPLEVTIARAEEAEAEERIRFHARQLERQQQLKERGMSREDAYDEARHNLDVARRRLEGAKERAARVIASLGGDAGLPVERHPRYLEAQAIREAAALELARTAVRAQTMPGTGYHCERYLAIMSMSLNMPTAATISGIPRGAGLAPSFKPRAACAGRE